MIETTADLEAACKELAKSEFITIDTEFLRETTFWPELCLIQMASPTTEVLVDPLAKGLDLTPFFELMANPAVLKVFHAARQDIEIIFNRGGLIPHPIFDTQVAAMVCGFGDSVSYDQLVSRTKDVQIDKSSRFTDWSRRPLSEKQLDYALADVTHLRDVYLYLEGRAGTRRPLLLASEEMDILEARETYDMHPDDAWQRLKMRLRKPQELAILKYVAAWREREARSRNVPRSRRAEGRRDLRDRPAAAEGRRGARSPAHHPEGLGAIGHRCRRGRGRQCSARAAEGRDAACTTTDASRPKAQPPPPNC